MQLHKKKALAVRALKVGSERIIFNLERTSEIKDAITKRDIKDLVSDKAISIKDVTGRRKIVKRKTRRRQGSIRVKKIGGKQEYVKLVRRLRKFISELRKKGILKSEDYWLLRKEIRSRNFRDRSHLKERINQIIQEGK